MGTITSLFVRKVVRAAGQDIDSAAVLRSVGLDPDRQIDVTERIADTAYYDLLETIAAQIDDAVTFPLRVGQSMDADDYGAFGLAWKTAPTLRGSLQRAERYAQLLTSVAAYELCETDRGAVFRTHRAGHRRLGMRLSNEATLASVTSIIRQVSPAPFTPLQVHFQHQAPASIAAHETYFGCPVHFGSDADEILISSGDLDRPNHLGDPAVSKFLDAHLQSQLAAQTGQTSFEDVMMRKISDALSEGVPRAARIARAMGVSERTLHRRVAQHGTSFQSILENAQRRLAEGLLVQSDHSIAEIAFLTGFSEQSAFTRAFKRWVNDTPAAFRESRKTAR